MPKTLKILKFVFLSAACSMAFSSAFVCQAQAEELKKGVARGTFMLQGYSFSGAPGTLRFYAAGAQAEESSLSYVDDAYISLDEGDAKGNPYELKGRFTGGPNGVATFTTPGEGFTFSVPLKDGRVFELNIPGVQVNMTVADPSIFDSEEYVSEEYDPNAPLEDSGVKISNRDGQLEIACPPDLDAWDVLKEDRVIYAHCHIKTGEDSTVELSFPDMTTFKMRPETELVIDAAAQKEGKIGLLAGKIWANVKKMATGGTMEIRGSQAVAGIKGTTFEMEDTGEMTTLKVIEGEVEFKDKADGKTETVGTGEALSVDLRGFGAKTAFDANAEEKKPAAAASDAANGSSENTMSKVNYPWWLIGSGALAAGIAAGVLMRRKKAGKAK